MSGAVSLTVGAEWPILEALMRSVIARRRLFSTAHLYEQNAFSPDKNREVFGACYSKYGHGHNYVLEVFVEGPIDQETGLVVNVNDLDVIMKTVIQPFDHRHISFDHPDFKNTIPTTENLTAHLYEKVKVELKKQLPLLSLNRIRLFETDDLWATAHATTSPKKGFEITREFKICSMHHLENAQWSESKNKDYYGMCYGTHGHDYQVRVTVSGSLDSRTGLAVDRDRLDQILEKEIGSKYHAVDLNKMFANTSCEQLAAEFFSILKPLLPTLVRVGIQETRKNYFEFPPAAGTA
jgi:6-pyruvoyltetrahydropterin/6-carboxytetrahydropterin synthase